MFDDAHKPAHPLAIENASDLGNLTSDLSGYGWIFREFPKRVGSDLPQRLFLGHGTGALNHG